MAHPARHRVAWSAASPVENTDVTTWHRCGKLEQISWYSKNPPPVKIIPLPVHTPHLRIDPVSLPLRPSPLTLPFYFIFCLITWFMVPCTLFISPTYNLGMHLSTASVYTEHHAWLPRTTAWVAWLLKSFTVLVCPFISARFSGVSPYWFIASVEAPALRNTSTTLAWPPNAAECNGVLPYWPIVSIEAPFPKSTSTTPGWPFPAARFNRVLLNWLVALIDAPFLRRSSTNPAWPPYLTDCNGILFYWPITSIVVPFPRSTSTATRWPPNAAEYNEVLQCWFMATIETPTARSTSITPV